MNPVYCKLNKLLLCEVTILDRNNLHTVLWFHVSQSNQCFNVVQDHVKRGKHFILSCNINVLRVNVPMSLNNFKYCIK